MPILPAITFWVRAVSFLSPTSPLSRLITGLEHCQAIITLVVGCGVLVSLISGANAAEDPFDAIDRQLEQNFEETDRTLEERYVLLNEALESAYQRLSKEVAATWGSDDVKLPQQKQWVDYTSDLAGRRVVDFEAGTVEIEQIVEIDATDTAEALATITNQIMGQLDAARTDSQQDFADKDLVMQYAREELAEKEVAMAPVAELPEAPVLDKAIRPVAEADLAAAIKAALDGTPPDTVETTDAQPPLRAAMLPVGATRKKVSVTLPFQPNYRQSLAEQYFAAIAREARRQELAPSLLLAVMETESAFNPRATSGVPAYGLMQLVPTSGALDAYLFVYGERMLLDPEYLYNPDQNVELGSAYLALLQNRYLRHIDNPRNKELCAIAAYNTGASNVARAFTGEKSVKAAARIINAMEPDAVYNHLRANLPYEETRNYIRKVTKAQEKYARYDDFSELDDYLGGI